MGSVLVGPPRSARLARALVPVGRALLLWHLCSLDAPSVAVVWAAALLQASGLAARPSVLLALAMGTWIIYVADRLFDAAAQGESVSVELAERHYFHRRHRRVFAPLSVAAAACLAWLCCSLDHRLRWVYLILAVPVGMYALSVHPRLVPGWAGTLGRRVPLHGARKDAAVALLFTAAVAAPALVAAPAGCRLPLLASAVALALVCWLNCAVIGVAEAPQATRRGRLVWLGSALSVLLGAGCAAGRSAGRPWALVAASLLASSVLLISLLLLPSGRLLLSRQQLRVAADLALLTPLLLWLPRF